MRRAAGRRCATSNGRAHDKGPTTPYVRPLSADDGNVDAVSLPDHRRWRREPKLIHGHHPHEAEANTHECAAPDHHQGEWMIQLGEIPGADIEHDGEEG